MPAKPADWTIAMALTAGVVLAIMTDWNSALARHSSPLFAAWTAHGVGALASLALVALLPGGRAGKAGPGRPWPLWSYLGGIPGAFVVLLAAVTVNSPLGLAGTLAMMLIGQMGFGVLADRFGLFRLRRRQIRLRGIAGLLLVSAGSVAILLARR